MAAAIELRQLVVPKSSFLSEIKLDWRRLTGTDGWSIHSLVVSVEGHQCLDYRNSLPRSPILNPRRDKALGEWVLSLNGSFERSREARTLPGRARKFHLVRGTGPGRGYGRWDRSEVLGEGEAPSSWGREGPRMLRGQYRSVWYSGQNCSWHWIIAYSLKDENKDSLSPTGAFMWQGWLQISIPSPPPRYSLFPWTYWASFFFFNSIMDIVKRLQK